MLLTVDIGTSIFKSAVWNFEGRRIAFASVPLSMKGIIPQALYPSVPHSFDHVRASTATTSLRSSISLNDGLRHEAASGQWLKAFEDCCRNLAANAPLAAVEAVVISGNGPTLVPVLGMPNYKHGVKPCSLSQFDMARAPLKSALPRIGGHASACPVGDGEGVGSGLFVPAAPARLWLDRRAVQAAERVSALVGGYVDAGFFLPKALDIKTNEPQLYEKTKYFLGCPELLAFALTGEARTVFPSDGFDRWYWNDLILDHFGMDKEKFPSFIRPGEIFGGLLPQAAAGLGLQPGLKQDIPVIAGGPDFFPAILGSGTVQPGQACDRAGTSEGINACTETFIADERLMCYGHPVKPFWNLSGIITATGKAVEWGRDLLGIKSYDDFFALAETAKAGAGGMVFLPYLAGERAPVWDSSARGILRGLGLSSGRPEFARSVLEGICFAIRDIIEIIEKCGAVVNELRIAGTASGSNLLNQIKADITGKPALVPRQKEAELLGLAVIGARTLGKYDSFSEAASAFVQIEKTLQPNKDNAALYDDLFDKYQKSKGYAEGVKT